jgi:hypothetical protein
VTVRRPSPRRRDARRPGGGMATRITATFDARPRDRARRRRPRPPRPRGERRRRRARPASALEEAALDEVPTGSAARPWYCSSCGETHDATTRPSTAPRPAPRTTAPRSGRRPRLRRSVAPDAPPRRRCDRARAPHRAPGGA